MKYEIGHITITVSVDAYTDEDDGELTVAGGSKPTLSVEVDLPVTDPLSLAVRHLRKVADQLESQIASEGGEQR